jgi:hypothetical protein
MQGSKIRLSPAEAALIGNAEVILTKNRIIEKTVALLAEVQSSLTAGESFSPSFSSPKISKGENYNGLPYVVLDYPRVSKGENLFFIRSMFWWGNFFSSTLQLAGHYKQSNLLNLFSAYETLAASDYFIGINADPWQHHFEASNYRKISAVTQEEYKALLLQQPQIKIAARWPLTQWDSAASSLLESWKLLAGLVA